MELKHTIKEKLSSIGSIFSSSLSFLGGYQVCHSVCLGIISALSIIGITVTGMPLFFLQSVAIPFWIAAVVLLMITLLFYIKKKCISLNLIIFNTGIIIAGTPFAAAQKYNIFLWIIGGLFVLISIILFSRSKIRNLSDKNSKE